MQEVSPLISQYLSQNWVSVSITFIISLFSIYGTKKVVEEYLSSATDERRSQAKLDLLDVLENHIINEKDISANKMSNLRNAIDRKHSVNLSDKLSKIELLQDIELRIEESSHLDSSQKEQYTTTIDDTISEIREDRDYPVYHTPYSHEYQADMMDQLRDEIESGNNEEALELLDFYEQEVEVFQDFHLYSPTFSGPRDMIFAIIVWVLLFVILYVSALGISEILGLNLLPASFNPIMWGSAITIFIVLAYYAFKSQTGWAV